MNAVNRFRPLPIVVALQAVFAMPMAQAADFTVNSATPVTTGQALNTAGNTGTVTSGSTLSTNGSTQAVTLTGSGTITLNNSGTIEQTGTARAIRNNAGPITFRLNNNGTISSLADDVLKMGVAASVFEFSNQGTIWQKGTGTASGQALDLRDLTSTGNVITNGSATNSSAMIRADGDDALRPGRNITITNYGTIISNGVVNTKCADYLGTLCTGAASAHDAIDIGGNTGVVVNNYGTISGPRHAITADTSVTVTNYAGGQIIGRNGSGVGSDGTGTVVNYGLISGRYAGAGMAYDFLNNRNTYTDPTQTTVNNGDGDGVDIDGVGTITNYGRIEGLGGGGYDSGGRPNGGDGLALGGGTVNNMAGAVIWGKSNGILVDDGANGTDTTNTVGNKNRGTATAAASAVSITNSGEIIGDRKVAIGLVGNWDDTVVNNAAGVITGGADTQQVDMLSTNAAQRPGAAIQMGAGNDTLTNYGRIEGKNGLAIDMGAGDDTTRLFAGGSTGVVIGTIDGGAGNDTLETGGVQSFSAGTVINYENFIVRDGRTTFDYALGTVNSVQVDAGAVLQVNGVLAATGNLTVNGSFKAAAGTELRTVAVGGNYAQGSAGTLQTRLGAANASDRIAATGTAVLADGATIEPVPQAYVASGSTYTVVSADGGLTATPANLKLVNSSALVSYTLSRSGNNLMLNAQRQATLSSMAPASLGAMGSALEALGQSGSSSANTLFGALDALPTAQAVNDALQQLAPETNRAGAQGSQAASGAVFSAFESRVASARDSVFARAASTGLSAGEAAGRRSWVQGLGAWGEQGQRAGATGYKIHAYGVTAGLETDRSANEVMGISLAYTKAGTDGQATAQGDNTRVDGISLGGYFSQNRTDMTLDGSVLLGQNSYKSQRQVTFPGFSQTVTGEYRGWQVAGQIEAGFPFQLDAAFSGRWLAGARAGYLSTGAYTEAGNAAVTQRIGASGSTSLQSVLGAELTRALSPTSSLQMRARYLREFSNSPDITASFVAGGPSFTAKGTAPNRDTLQIGIGFTRITPEGVTLTLRYDAEAKDKYLAHQLSARASWAF